MLYEVITKNVNYFTRTMGNKETEILQVSAMVKRRIGNTGLDFNVSLGRLKVTDQVTGFQRRVITSYSIHYTKLYEASQTTTMETIRDKINANTRTVLEEVKRENIPLV